MTHKLKARHSKPRSRKNQMVYQDMPDTLLPMNDEKKQELNTTIVKRWECSNCDYKCRDKHTMIRHKNRKYKCGTINQVHHNSTDFMSMNDDGTIVVRKIQNDENKDLRIQKHEMNNDNTNTFHID